MTANRIRYSRRNVLKKGAIATGALILGGTAATGTAAGIGDGRVADYHLNNLHGKGKYKDIVHDASPYKNHGTNHGAEVVKDGAVGKAFEFDGSTAWLDSNHTLHGDSKASVAGWFKTSSGDRFGGIFGHRLNLRESGGGLTFRTTRDGAVELIVNGWDNGTNPNPRYEFSYADNEWHHLAGVYDGEEVLLYVDGEQEDSANYSEGLNPLGRFEVGRYKWDDQGDEWYFEGTLDEVRVYNRALSEGEIQDLVDMKD